MFQPRNTQQDISLPGLFGFAEISNYISLFGGQSPNPDIDLIAAWRGTAPEERKLHEEFAHKRKRGEWFVLTDEDVENIKTRFAGREQWKFD